MRTFLWWIDICQGRAFAWPARVERHHLIVTVCTLSISTAHNMNLSYNKSCCFFSLLGWNLFKLIGFFFLDISSNWLKSIAIFERSLCEHRLKSGWVEFFLCLKSQQCITILRRLAKPKLWSPIYDLTTQTTIIYR